MDALSFENAVRLKTEVLVRGIDLSALLNAAGNSQSIISDKFQPTIKAIYDNDPTPHHSVTTPGVLTVPLTEAVGGTSNVYIKVRANDKSPIKLSFENGRFQLDLTALRKGRYDLAVLEKPSFYGSKISCQGELVHLEVFVQRLGPDIVGTTLSNYCAYFSMLADSYGVKTDQKDLGCSFCELTTTYRDNRLFRSATKPLAAVLEAFNRAISIDPNLDFLLITSGTPKRKNQGPDYDAIFKDYIEMVRQLRVIAPHKFIYVMPNPPQDLSLIDRMAEAAGDLSTFSMLFNIEIIDESLAKKLTPGKFFHYGRGLFWQACERALKNGITLKSSYIFGLQSYDPFSKVDYDENKENVAVERAATELVSRGIIPTMSLYHASPASRTGLIPFTPEGVFEGHRGYAQVVLDSGLVNSSKWSPFGSQSSLTNKLDGNVYALCKLKQREP